MHLALAVRLLVAHLTGLVAAAAPFSVDWTRGTVDDFMFFFLIAAAASLPVFGGVMVLVMLFARRVEDNLLAFVLGGPVLVCLGGVALGGTELLAPLALATGTASLAFAALVWLDCPRAGRRAA